MEQNLLESAFPVHYFGFLFQEFDATTSAVRSRVYEHWDNSSTSPPKERPREERAAEVACPPLGALAWAGKQPVFPQVLVDRFLEGSAEHAQIMAKKKEFDAMFPAAAQPPPTSVPARAGGLCDFSVDSGRAPLDVSRCIDLPSVSVADFETVRVHLVSAIARGFVS